MQKITCCEVKCGKHGNNQKSFQLCGNSVTTDTIVGCYEDTSIATSISNILSATFLPIGYPNSVRPEYVTYQFWDSLQGMSSYLRSVLTTRSVLAGAGVGSAESTALAAALTWVFRDGVGMIGSLIFAYCYADTFEVYIKEWRYLADILNNIGLTLDLLSSYFPRHYFAMMSVSTLCKACCGLIAGATKARISAHFAMPGHLADVTAKESTQETAVALCGLVVGMLLAQVIGSDDVSTWLAFAALLALHQYSNYHLVKVLVFSNFNPQRCSIIVDLTYAQICAGNSRSRDGDSPINDANSAQTKLTKLPSPSLVASKESFLQPIYLSLFGPVFGGSISEIIKSVQFIVVNRSGQFPAGGWLVEPEQRCTSVVKTSGVDIWRCNVYELFTQLCRVWEKEQFLVGLDGNGRIIVSLQEGVSERAVVKAYLVGYFVFHKLKVKLALYGASLESKFRYLTELFQQLISTVAGEALLWYDSLALDDEQSKGDCCWNIQDITALSTGEYRYLPLQKEKSQ